MHGVRRTVGIAVIVRVAVMAVSEGVVKTCNILLPLLRSFL